MNSFLTQEQIEPVIAAMPPQGRIMLRLLLLQYLDVTAADVDYMAADRPDPRLQAGKKSLALVIPRETLEGITDRAAQYRNAVRQKRERLWLQIECLRRQIALSEAICSLAERLLVSRFGLSPDAVQSLTQQARNAVPKPMMRELDGAWERNEITEEAYQCRRLSMEYQTQLRRLDRQRKRMDIANQGYQAVSSQPLQDHEIAHIWGIPAGSLAARKLKYLQQYLQSLQAKIRETSSGDQEASTPPVDLWKETLAVLAHQPVERSMSTYDGLEGTETALIDKLTAFASGALPEDVENKLWLSLVQEISHQAEYGTKLKSLFALQRFAAILSDIDAGAETLEQELLARVSPPAKATVAQLEEAPAKQEDQLSEMGEHVLRSFIGEARQL